MAEAELVPGHCRICGMLLQVGDGPVCSDCKPGVPLVLIRATQDPFDYALGLVSGEVIRFREARLQGKWVVLEGMDEVDDLRSPPYPCPHGMYVRLKHIVWVAAAPEGS